MNLNRIFSLILIFGMTACQGSPSDAAASASSIGSGLEAGQFEVNVAGYINDTGPYVGTRPPAEFRVNRITGARERNDGFGGRTAVDASNAEGPYQLVLRLALQREGHEPEMGNVWIQLPAGAAAGKTYPLRNNARARDGEAYGALEEESRAWMESSNLDGSIQVAELGDTLTAAFEFHNNQEPNSGKRIEVSGRVFKLPFSPRGEASFSTTTDGGETENRTISAGANANAEDNTLTILLGTQIYFAFNQAEPAPGTYQIAKQRSDQAVGLTIAAHSFDNVNGTITLEKGEQYYSGSYNFTTAGSSSRKVTGTFDYIKVP